MDIRFNNNGMLQIRRNQHWSSVVCVGPAGMKYCLDACPLLGCSRKQKKMYTIEGCQFELGSPNPIQDHSDKDSGLEHHNRFRGDDAE